MKTVAAFGLVILIGGGTFAYMTDAQYAKCRAYHMGVRDCLIDPNCDSEAAKARLRNPVNDFAHCKELFELVLKGYE